MLRWSSNTDVIKAQVVESMDWVIEKMNGIDEELTNEAVGLKRDVSEGSIKEVVQAMNAVNGYDYGGSWNSHWYQCPNGHPYFIGECGQAMQESRCIECGEPVGGSGHSLLGTNRGAGGGMAEAMR